MKDSKKKQKPKRKKRARGCKFCEEKIHEVDYKDVGRIRRYMSGRGKILSCKLTGVCARHQRSLTRAIKRARYMALLPYIQV
ncbi:MAG: 30S ribosomal protein S18 [candidate division TA06 bacterium ADurb.Bin131]|jgi:small subunit ribosomal protein S18|uniref:Small ribosomal subunit protein bS18 n=1 Tax=candidate division TA06 bacterium ADurb.Bin131 TaxID=1852827 RepID=A0A1V6CA42_UNCT6|nr:MAG: 30S ribosomal protein S18 [candidate division TA06 bacterium ADurb.Bin131]